MISVQCDGTNVAAGIYNRTAAVLARTAQRGPWGSVRGDFYVLLSFFILDHGAGGLILSGLFGFFSLVPVKGIEVAEPL